MNQRKEAHGYSPGHAGGWPSAGGAAAGVEFYRLHSSLRLKYERLHVIELLVANIGSVVAQRGAEKLGVGGVIGKHVVVAGNRHLPGFDVCPASSTQKASQ